MRQTSSSPQGDNEIAALGKREIRNDHYLSSSCSLGMIKLLLYQYQFVIYEQFDIAQTKVAPNALNVIVYDD